MSKVRKISAVPMSGRNYFLVDFLVTKFIPPAMAPLGTERERISACLDWWAEIEMQLLRQRATSLIRRFADPEEVASLVAYVASPLASATTGAALRVDGGVIRSAF